MFTTGPAQLDTNALTQAIKTNGLELGFAGTYSKIGPNPPAILIAQTAAPIINTYTTGDDQLPNFPNVFIPPKNNRTVAVQRIA
ncbi:hypothetical protein D3C78_938220 [compost metagenome]